MRACWFVYKLTDEVGDVFYVGMTRNFPQRMSQHYCAIYGDRIDSVSTERFDTEDEGAARELELIRELTPDLNRRGIVPEAEPERLGVCACGTALAPQGKVCRDCVATALEAFLTDDRTMIELGRERQVPHERNTITAGPAARTVPRPVCPTRSGNRTLPKARPPVVPPAVPTVRASRPAEVT